jgi:hypothetical protein
MSFECSLNLKYDWIPLRTAEGAEYQFPSPLKQFLPSDRTVSGINRWTVERSAAPTKPSVLIGESENLVRRLAEYAKPTTPEETVWNALFSAEVKAGSKIRLDLLKLEGASLDGAVFDQRDLGDPFVRKSIAGVLVTVQRRQGDGKILNKGKHANAKAAEKLKTKIGKLTRQIAHLERLSPKVHAQTERH